MYCLSCCHRTASNANYWMIRTFHCSNYFVFGGFHTCLRVFNNPMFLLVSSHSYPLNLLLVRSHQPDIIIVKHFIQGNNNVTRVLVEPDHAIGVVVKSMPLLFQPPCRLLCHYYRLSSSDFDKFC